MEYRHTMGAPVSSDVVILGQGVSLDVTVPDYDFPNAALSAASPYALAVVAGGVATFQTHYIGDQSALLSHKGWHKFADVQDKVTDASLKGNDLYAASFDDTLNGKLLRLDAAHPGLKTPTVLVPPGNLVFSGGFIGSDVLHQAKGGGGELGEGWHLAGKMETKPNTWGDFTASAQYLIDHKYTSTAKLGVWSQSAGGILIGRAITARPDLFAAAEDGMPCSDRVRIETGPNGPTNIDEFGTVKNEDGFKGLYTMSAYHHVVPGTNYPAVLVTAGANDPRVEPWQGAKMAAALEAAQAGPKPILLRVNYDAGHEITDTLQQQVSDIFTFFLWNMGDPAFQPASRLVH